MCQGEEPPYPGGGKKDTPGVAGPSRAGWPGRFDSPV